MRRKELRVQNVRRQNECVIPAINHVADGTITQVETLRALDAGSVYSREPVRYVLEVPAGWLARHGIAVGTKVAIPAEATQPAAAPTQAPGDAWGTGPVQ